MFDDDKDRLTPVADLETLARVEGLRAELAAMIAGHRKCYELLVGTPAADVVRRQLDALLFAENAIAMLYD